MGELGGLESAIASGLVGVVLLMAASGGEVGGLLGMTSGLVGGVLLVALLLVSSSEASWET